MPLTVEQQKEVERLIPYARTIAASFGADPDYMSEAYFTLCEAVLKFDPARGPLDQFVGLCIRHRLIRVKERERGITGVDMSAVPATPDSSPGIYEAIDKLPDYHRAAAISRWIDRGTWKQVANRLGVSQAQARRIVDEARELLCQLLADSASLNGE